MTVEDRALEVLARQRMPQAWKFVDNGQMSRNHWSLRNSLETSEKDLAALKEAGLVIEEDWQPMETAPQYNKEGAEGLIEALIYSKSKGWCRAFLPYAGGWISRQTDTTIHDAVAIKPLPAPPEATK